MVRLKAEMPRVKTKIIAFQFLVVRLKVKMEVRKIDYTKFQFLVVRLKARQSFRPNKYNRISIPCGSIKRPTQRALEALPLHFNSLWFD